MLVLAAMIGGGNLATGLSTALALGMLAFWLFVKKGDHRFYVLAIAIVYMIAFAANIAAPGNAIRAQTPGYHKMSPVLAVLLSAWRSALSIYSMTNYKMWLMLLIAAPLLWRAVGGVSRNWRFSFRFPAAATVLLFGIYASQLTPIIYVSGTYGPDRMADMVWFSYVLWFFCVAGYWMGWVRCRYAGAKRFAGLCAFLSKNLGILQICALALWCALVLPADVKHSSSYKACADLKDGKASAYAAENEKRLEILRNPEIQDVWFERIQNHPLLIYREITDDNQNYSNRAMADFYRKNTVNLIVE